MKEQNIDWLVVTETWLVHQSGASNKPIEHDTWLVSLNSRKRLFNERGRGSNGLALMVRPGTFKKIEELDKDDKTARWAIWRIDGCLLVGNYWPPSLPANEFQAEMEALKIKVDRLSTADTLVTDAIATSRSPVIWVGDFNAKLQHHTGRYRDDLKGRVLRQIIENSDGRTRRTGQL